MAVIKVSNDMFQEKVLSNPKPVLVDFYADWCMPCKMLTPVIEEIAAEHPDVKVVKLNVDNAPEIASRYSVMSIPMLLVFKNGQVTGKSVGYSGKQAITDML